MSLRNQMLVTAAALTLALAVGCSKNKTVEKGEAPAQAMPVEPAPEKVEMPTAKAELGQPAPNFKLTDTDGNEVSLADFRGQKVVLEWFNPECPFVVFAHEAKGPLANQPKRYSSDGVAWLAINSGGEGLQGAGEGTNKKFKGGWGMDYPLLLDPTGRVGKLYNARTTPHMFIIDEQGILVYQGALDNAPRGELDGKSPVNYIDQAFAELAAGGPVTENNTKPYGCGVKYAD